MFPNRTSQTQQQPMYSQTVCVTSWNVHIMSFQYFSAPTRRRIMSLRSCEANHNTSTAINLHNYNDDQIVKSETKVSIAQSCFAQLSNYESIHSILI